MEQDQHQEIRGSGERSGVKSHKFQFARQVKSRSVRLYIAAPGHLYIDGTCAGSITRLANVSHLRPPLQGWSYSDATKSSGSISVYTCTPSRVTCRDYSWICTWQDRRSVAPDAVIGPGLRTDCWDWARAAHRPIRRPPLQPSPGSRTPSFAL